MFIIAFYVCGVIFIYTVGQKPNWYLKIAASSNIMLVSENGMDRFIVDNSKGFNINETLSPDGRLILFVNVEDGDAEIYVKDLTTQVVNKLTDNAVPDNHPVWSPDGQQIAYSSKLNSRWQVYVMDNDGSNVKQITDALEGACNPKFSSTGELVYLRMINEPENEQLVDLIIFENGKERTLLAKIRITFFACSPNAMLFAVGELGDDGGKIQLIDLSTGANIKIDLKSEVDERLYWHSAFQIHWRPDNKAIACRLSFVGSRMVSSEKIFGDDEIFIIGLDGLVNWFKFEEADFQILGWENLSR